MEKVKELIEETIEIEKCVHFSESFRFREIMKILYINHGIDYWGIRMWQQRLLTKHTGTPSDNATQKVV